MMDEEKGQLPEGKTESPSTTVDIDDIDYTNRNPRDLNTHLQVRSTPNIAVK